MGTKGPGARRDLSPCTESIIVRRCGDTTIRRSGLEGGAAGGRGASGGRTPRPTSPRSVKALSWLSAGGAAGRIPGRPGPPAGRSRGSPAGAGRGSGRAGGGIAGIRRGLRQRIRVPSTGAGARSVRWPHGSGRRCRELWELGGSVGGSPTVARAGRAAVYAASAFRVVMDRMVPHPDIADYPAACLEALGTVPQTSEIPGLTWGNAPRSIPRTFRVHWRTAASDCLRLPEPCGP